MVFLQADNIISPLGTDTQTNFEAVMAGQTGLQKYDNLFAPVEPFVASLMKERRSFVDLCIAVTLPALEQSHIDATANDVVFVLSTTKGDNLKLWEPAKQIATHFGNTNPPIVVSNACISGVSAQVVAARLIESGKYNTAIVVGCDIQTKFIVSGFQSFKALSNEPCRPFDKQRTGLNLGEAAACMILSKTAPSSGRKWIYEAGSMHNDANHISGPSRTGDGSFRCLQDCLASSSEQPAFISVHGTATPYNDEMEAIALGRAQLNHLPILALKGYWGHTMGTAGLLETIISMKAIEKGEIPGSKGYEEQGTTIACQLSACSQKITGNSFIKLLSGFGGCNAAVKWIWK